MAHGKNQRLRFKRRRVGETDYRRRMKLLRGDKPRAVVRVSNTQIICQLVEFNPDGDFVLASVNGKNLVDKYSWPKDISRKSVPASYLAGFALGKNAIAAGYENAVLDIGLSASSTGSRVFAALRGMVDAGLDIPHGDQVFPDDDRINGVHIDESMGAKVKKSLKAIEEA
jgi:large subunit ribosomal protein L18